MSSAHNQTLELAELLTHSYATTMSHEGGFLPATVPLSQLPAPFDLYIRCLEPIKDYYAPGTGGTRRWLQVKLKDFDESWIQRLPELNREQSHKLLSVLTLLAHLYRWDMLPAAPEYYTLTQLDLPAGIQVPLKILAAQLKHPACGTMWSMVYCNWALKDRPGGSSYRNQDLRPEQMVVPHNWLDGELAQQLEQFIFSFVLTEAKGAPALQTIVDCVRFAAAGQRPAFVDSLKRLERHIGEINQLFIDIVNPHKIDYKRWREVIQPTFIWGLDSEQTGLRLEGASGLQVGIIQSLDAVLGLNAQSEMGQAAIRSRYYMPSHHQRFLAVLDRCRSIVRTFILTADDLEATAAYNRCIEKMKVFRAMHKAKGRQYIKGDGQPRTITTTGLSIQENYSAEQSFQILMKERIVETNASLVGHHG